MDKCRKCGETKPISDFPKDKCAKKGYSLYCKPCKREKIKVQYYKDPAKKIAKTKEWSKQNSEHVSEYNKIRNNNDDIKLYRQQYYRENKERIDELNRGYNKKRYIKSTNINPPEERKLIQTYRDRVKRGIQTDRKKTFELLGCSFAELKIHIESQFYPEMDWDNWGKVWELDHIIGCVNFDFNNPDELAKCFHYTNLRPLFKTTKIAESFGYTDIIGNRNRKRYH
jgi:hypothetical protein